ncbi:unnamed protein product [Linum tenue]|uniref:AP2/ERF domain-containing protein n=1 Tax=Linum tenue TaxID=586396 RepID=A0AAV0MND1_9ROSI|nr:unnamed protein product [Linum tenue]
MASTEPPAPQQYQQSSSEYYNEPEPEPKYKGVRKRKWGKWVSEIRLPNSRERIWLGSYTSPEKAARAFDAALFCLRGPAARFNFPDDPPDSGRGRSLSPQEIQALAVRYANNYNHATTQATRGGEEEATRTTTTTTLSPRAGNGGSSDTTIDWSFLGILDSREQGAATTSAATSDHHFELFSGMDNMSMSVDMNMGGGDYYHDPHHMVLDGNNDVINGDYYYHHHDEAVGYDVDGGYSQSSFLWNF